MSSESGEVGVVSVRFASLRKRASVSTTLPEIVLDAVVAALCYVATVALPVRTGWPLFTLAALASLPLLWRRRYPVAVAALVGAGTIGLAVSGPLGQIPLAYGQLVATYTVAALAPPLWRLITMAATAAGVIIAVLLVLAQGPAALATAALPFVAAYALGVGVRARRDRIAMLEERTFRLAEEQEAAAARERERIARDIHDIVAHSVSLMVVQAEAGLVLARDPDKAAHTFDTISATGREALTQLDRALAILGNDEATRRPQPDLGELPALVERARAAGLDARMLVHGPPRAVPADLAATVYRLLQEAVTNTIKHAAARAIQIRVDWLDDALSLEVADDGRGPGRASAPGRGLIGMRQRVHAFGGQLTTGAGEEGVGFRIRARLPLGHTGVGPADG